MLNIRPCPFCGGEAEVAFSDKGSVRYMNEMGEVQYTPFLYTIRCMECDCRIGNYVSPNKAMTMWNSRKEANE